MARVIDPDDETTWPDELVSFINTNISSIIDYEEHQARLNSLSTLQYLRLGQPKNPFREDRDRVIASIDADLREFHIIGYHATRVTESEAADLAGGLLEVLSMDLVKRRVDRACGEGLFSSEQGAELIRSSQAADLAERHGKRLGIVWMIFFKSLARDNGLYRLFRFWGGEATYWAHEETALGDALQRAGRPALLKCEAKISDLNPHESVASRLVAAFAERRGTRCVNGYEFESYSRAPVRVSKVIRWGTEEFDDLTGHQDWCLTLD